jgi:hypothetical protein
VGAGGPPVVSLESPLQFGCPIRTRSGRVRTMWRMAILGRVAHPQIQRPGTSYTTQSRFGSFTYKRFTVPQEVHRSAKRVSRLSLSDHLKKPFSFSLQRRPGRTSPPPPEAETVRPLMSWEPPQCSHVLLGMDNYSPWVCPRPSPHAEQPICRSVLRRPLHAIDNQRLHRPLLRIELEPQAAPAQP